ncbi:GFA family protein [Leisingera sp. ANG-Vp]|uniref:GFA family protein n=1 Tax=Leisingera sp. ANG-Vp TaxID=1577896 RepID=UPI00068F52D5|nr:GFA family protein [Leisingera sp. ANG-Vp]
MTKLSGRCQCGAISWETDGPVLWAGHCHCDSCRRASSAAFTSFFGVPRDGVAWTGTPAVNRSSAAVERGFCPSCGAQVFYRSTRWPAETHLFAATLDDLAQFEPQAHFHWAERVAWTQVSDGLPKYAASAEGAEPVENGG